MNRNRNNRVQQWPYAHVFYPQQCASISRRIFTELLIVGFSLLLLSGCGGQEPEVRLRLTPAERSRIDTIYQERIGTLRPLWDSLCDVRFDSVVIAARDSIVYERLEEEAELRRRQNDDDEVLLEK